MVLCFARLRGIPEIDHAQSFAALEASFRAVHLRRVQASESAPSSFASCSALLAFQPQKPNVRSMNSNTKRGEGETDQALFDALVTDLSSEGFFTFNEITNTLHP